GLLADLEDPVEKKDRDYYPGLYDELFHNGKHIAHSANVSILMYMCNKEALRKTGQTLPPYRWRFEEFEKMGREYVKEANRGEKRQTRFFADKVNRELMRRSLGVSWFNETMTKSALNDPRNVEVLLKIHQWTFEDHIIPSLGEIQSLSTDLVQGFGGAPVQLFHRGNFAMILFGTWVLVSLRELGTPIDLGAVEPPHGGFPTTDIYGRVIAVYSGSPNKKEAGQFIEFLSSESFNRNVIESGDGYPPDPAYLSDPSLLHPATYSNEWLLHEAFAKASMEISQCREYSSFCQLQDYIRKEEDAFYGFMSGLYSAESATEQMGRQMDNAIQAYLGRRPKLFESYQAALERQKKIDAVKKAGKKIPLELVDNPVLKRFYLETGRGE
ncbi:MAG: extracellular solute-binding protein, partial [Spirochaetia bacterium]|nr:extracellular solute-binding protein [Spirochaetia bacterium]